MQPYPEQPQLKDDFDRRPEGPQGTDWNLQNLGNMAREIKDTIKSGAATDIGGEIALAKLVKEAFQQAQRVVADPDVLPASEEEAGAIAQNLARTLKENGFENMVPDKKSSDPHSQNAAGWLFNKALD